MNNLNNLAQGMNIGDRSSSAFIELSRIKTIGNGLFDSTTDNRYRWLNTRNNYPRTASYYSIQRTLRETQMPFKRFFNGNLVSAYNIDGLDIGWAYTTDENANKLSRGYASSADFNEFQNLLRGEQLTRNDLQTENNLQKKYNNSKIEVEKYDGGESDLGISPIPYGEEYKDRIENFVREHNDVSHYSSLDDLKKLNSYTTSDEILYGISQPENKSSNNEFGKFELGKSRAWNIQHSGLTINNYKYSGHLRTNQVIKEFGDSNRISSSITVTGRTYHYVGEDLNPTDENIKITNFLNESITSGGLLTFYIKDRTKNTNINTLLKYYSPEKQYGTTAYIGSRENKENVKLTDLRKVDTSAITHANITDNGGSLVDGIKYTFYDEGIGYEVEKNLIENFQYNTFLDSNASKLLKYTNRLFKTNEIKTMVNRFGVNNMSRGRNLMKETNNSNGSPYCRVWTARHQYATYKDTIRPFGAEDDMEAFHSKLGVDLRPNNSPARLNNYSVLQNNGLVRITPQIGEIEDESRKIQNYMFSIENLAWIDSNNLLSKEQRGPKGGRIMWFPPYNLRFTENVNVSWNGNNFIGRGEQIYTYVNTDRKGTLDFTLLIDHPSILNKWAEKSSNIGQEEKELKKLELLRFFAGCGDLKFEEEKQQELKEIADENTGDNIEPKPTTITEKIAYIIFFPNNYSGYDLINSPDEIIKDLNNYEKTDGVFFEKTDSSYKDQKIKMKNRKNTSEYGLNSGRDNLKDKIVNIFFNNDDKVTVKFLDDIAKINGDNITSVIGEENKGDKIFGYNALNTNIKNVTYYGTASSHGKKELNAEIANRRGNSLKACIEKYCTFIDKAKNINGISTRIIDVNDINDEKNVNSYNAKIARSAYVVFEVERNIDSKPKNNQTENSINGLILTNGTSHNERQSNIMTKTETIKNAIDSGYDNEYSYFKKIKSSDKLVKHIVDKVKYFDPAYHSITPEGFNARLTFLHQCTRQGSTVSLNGGNTTMDSSNYLKYAGNLSFGRAPFCILRIGDFFNTKICIDSISINYDNSGGSQWDLNIEGAGVQPMMANISMNFTFLGGQDLSGPIERLQNAISSNYYANASVYDKRAEINNNL